MSGGWALYFVLSLSVSVTSLAVALGFLIRAVSLLHDCVTELERAS